jgi:hypothetical protein
MTGGREMRKRAIPLFEGGGRGTQKRLEFIPMVQQPIVGQGLLTIEASRSHSDTRVGRILLDKWSGQHKGLYLTIHNTYNQKSSIPLEGFETSIPADQRLLTYSP